MSPEAVIREVAVLALERDGAARTPRGLRSSGKTMVSEFRPARSTLDDAVDAVGAGADVEHDGSCSSTVMIESTTASRIARFVSRLSANSTCDSTCVVMSRPAEKTMPSWPWQLHSIHRYVPSRRRWRLRNSTNVASGERDQTIELAKRRFDVVGMDQIDEGTALEVFQGPTHRLGPRRVDDLPRAVTVQDRHQVGRVPKELPDVTTCRNSRWYMYDSVR